MILLMLDPKLGWFKAKWLRSKQGEVKSTLPKQVLASLGQICAEKACPRDPIASSKYSLHTLCLKVDFVRIHGALGLAPKMKFCCSLK